MDDGARDTESDSESWEISRACSMEEITILLEDLARDAQTTKRRAAVLARLEALAGDVEALAAGERARRARALVVVILARAAPRLRGCDVVEAVGGGRAGEALVDAHAFLSRDENPVVERWAAALLDATLPGAYAQHIGFDDAAPMAERVRDFSAKGRDLEHVHDFVVCLERFRQELLQGFLNLEMDLSQHRRAVQPAMSSAWFISI